MGNPMEGFDASGVLTVEEPLAEPWDALQELNRGGFKHQYTALTSKRQPSRLEPAGIVWRVGKVRGLRVK